MTFVAWVNDRSTTYVGPQGKKFLHSTNFYLALFVLWDAVYTTRNIFEKEY